MYQGINAERALRIVRESPLIAFDTETTGLELKDRAVGYVITDADNSLYVPVRHEAGGNIPNTTEFESALNHAFLVRGRLAYRTVGHNLGFDLRMAGRENIRPQYPLEDTLINEALIDDTTASYSLENCCKRHGVAAKKGEALYSAIAARFGGLPDRKSMSNFWRMPGDDADVVDYACGDGVSTLALRNAQQKYLDEEDLRRVWHLECQLLRYVADMHLRGLKVDMAYADELLGESGIMASAIAAGMKKFEPGFNPYSPKDVEALYRANGYDDGRFMRTATGKPSFTSYFLETNEIGDAIMAVRKLRKARDAFASNIVGKFNVGGRVHPILHQSRNDEYGVAGARFSCSDPNFQAIPKRNAYIGKMVRKLIIPDDGMELFEADAKQQEPRFFAYYSGDENLLQGYRNETIDIHDIASAGLGIDRKVAKTLGLGILNMMQPKTLARHMRWEVPKAAEFHRGFLDLMPRIRDFQDHAKAIFASTGYVKSILGRRARLENGDKWLAYRGSNRVIQNSAGDHLKTCILRACEYAEAYPDKLQMLMTVHDSIVGQNTIGFDRSELIRIMEAVPYEPEFDLDLPIPFDVGVGMDWCEASYGK
jgi:DNA polymerase-1